MPVHLGRSLTRRGLDTAQRINKGQWIIYSNTYITKSPIPLACSRRSYLYRFHSTVNRPLGPNLQDCLCNLERLAEQDTEVFVQAIIEHILH
jgi:hypothetical protein